MRNRVYTEKTFTGYYNDSDNSLECINGTPENVKYVDINNISVGFDDNICSLKVNMDKFDSAIVDSKNFVRGLRKEGSKDDARYLNKLIKTISNIKDEGFNK